MQNNEAWQGVLAAAERLQELVPDAVLVGGTAAALHAGHRVSLDDDHVIARLSERFDQTLEALEATDGWVTARVRRPVMILGRLDGVETGIRNLIRSRPLEVEEVSIHGHVLRVTTLPEILRVKAWLCLMRNATRDYVDLVAIADRLGDEAVAVLLSMDDYYQDQLGQGGLRIATQVAKQLAEPKPGDLAGIDLSTYRQLDRRWHSWTTISDRCRQLSVGILANAGEDPR